jgi:uncharacterized membrane protein
MAQERIAQERAAAIGRAARIFPVVRRIGLGDVGAALAEGVADFRANPTHLFFLCLAYPVMGVVLARLASGDRALPMLYPIVAGFALVGPIAAVGLYEISRRREAGQPTSWRDAFGIVRSPRFASIAVLGGMLIALYILWIIAAEIVYDLTLRPMGLDSLPALLQAAVTTPEGWAMVVVGTGIGFLFAVLALTLGVVSIPLLVDRDVGRTPAEEAAVAVRTSVRAVARNPWPMTAWGLIVVAGMLIGTVTLLVGFAVVVPVMGHATWHLYRRVVA